jgi:dolichol-phosphate mannosyltransferase
MLSLGAAKYVKWITGMPFSDPTGGYKCFRRRALESVDLADVRSNGYSFQIEMTHKIWRQGLRVAEQNIVFTERIEGTSKMSWHIAWEAVWMVWRLWLQHGLRRWPKKKQG